MSRLRQSRTWCFLADDDDVALKQRKKLKTKVEDVDLKTKSTNKPSLHKTESAAAASPCNIRRAITAADLNIQLRYEIGRFPSHKPVFSRQNNYTPGYDINVCLCFVAEFNKYTSSAGCLELLFF